MTNGRCSPAPTVNSNSAPTPVFSARSTTHCDSPSVFQNISQHVISTLISAQRSKLGLHTRASIKRRVASKTKMSVGTASNAQRHISNKGGLTSVCVENKSFDSLLGIAEGLR